MAYASYKGLWHRDCLINSDALSLFPGCVIKEGKRKSTKMNTLKQILFTITVVIGLSIAISAQKNDDQKKPPPKDPPPVVNPGGEKKPPRDNPPRDTNKPKKP